jgi:hypothetical protein
MVPWLRGVAFGLIVLAHEDLIPWQPTLDTGIAAVSFGWAEDARSGPRGPDA